MGESPDVGTEEGIDTVLLMEERVKVVGRRWLQNLVLSLTAAIDPAIRLSKCIM
jgi:hypothetical protein